jgi:hypothetical protein
VRLVAIVALVLLFAAVPNALATTQPDLIVGVDVALKAHAVTLSAKQVRRGYYVQFRVRNTTPSARIFTLAGRKISVPAKKLRYLVISFDVRGTYRYSSRLASGSAVIGTFRVS